ncbi:MAG: hypothetical protein WA876_12480 [Candidatus Acidiferrales bacterium]
MSRMTRSIAALVPIFLGIACVAFLACSNAFPRAAAGARIHLIPNFAPGQTFRYGVQMRIDTTSAATGPITNAGGPRKLDESVGVIIRLDVLSFPDAPGAPASARIRATYEKATATTNSAAYDPDVAAMEDQYKKLAGQSIEFTLQADGKITNVTGLKDLASDSDPSRAAMLNQWISQLTLGASLPKQGIAIGEKWSSQQPLENIPLDGLAWKTTATYERNEPCPAAGQPSEAGGVSLTPASSPEQCAIILTRSEIVGGSDSKERTPGVFRQNGLRTSGVWTGNAESLASISLRTGMVSSVTQTGSTHMDFTIMTHIGQNRMRYAGDTHTQSEITLLPPSAIP